MNYLPVSLNASMSVNGVGKPTEACDWLASKEEFYETASLLRQTLDSSGLLDTVEYAASVETMGHLFKRSAHAAAEVFDEQILHNFVGQVRKWVSTTLGCAHVSSPALWVYGPGCWRAVVKDSVKAKQHYIYSLCRPSKSHNQAIVFGRTVGVGGDWRLLTMEEAPLSFNKLLVHDVAIPYGFPKVSRRCAIADGIVVFDGYVW